MSEVKKTTTNRPNTTNQIDLIRLFEALLRKWYILLLCTVIGYAYMSSQVVTPPDMYQSSSMLFVVSNNSTISTLTYDLQLGTMLSGDFIVIAKSKPVIDTAIQTVYEKTGTQLTRGEASGAISVNVMEGTRILKFTVTMDNPQMACELCNAITDAVADQMSIIMHSEKPSVIEYAEPSSYPLFKPVSRQPIKGAIVGFGLAAAVLCALFLLDDKVKTPEDVEKYVDAPVLACIQMDKAQVFDSRKHAKKTSSK